MKKLVVFLFAVSMTFVVKAQHRDSLWTVTLPSEVKWQTQTPDGTLIIKTQEQTLQNKGAKQYSLLTAVDPQTGAVKWKYPTSIPNEDTFIERIENVPNTPFIIPKFNRGPLIIIDPYDGHILLDLSKEEITNLEGYDFLLESGHMWVTGTFNGERCMSMFDLRTGKKLWSIPDFLKERNKAVSKINKFNALSASLGGGTVDNKEPVKLLCKPINHGADALILATRNGIFHVQIATGAIDWEAEQPDPNKGKAIKVEVDVNFARLIPGPGETFYVVKAAYFMACNYKDGKAAWSNFVKTSGPIDKIIYDEKGMILCPGSSNAKGMLSSNYIKMVNEKTGEEYWGDGIKFNGGISNYLYTDKGLAVVMVNSSGNEKNSINFIDVAAGKFVLSKNVNVDGAVEYLELTPKGLLYKTNKDVNILGLETDKSILALPKSKSEIPILTVNSQDFFYYYSDDEGKVYEINKAEGSSKILNKGKIEFGGKETPAFMERRSDGSISLYSTQNVTLITPTGDTKFNVYNPGVRTVIQALTNAVGQEGAFLDMITLQNLKSSKTITATMTPDQKNNYSKYQQAYAAAGSAAYITDLKQFEAIMNRYHAFALTNDVVFMMTKVDDRSVLLGINKDSGTSVSKVLLAKRDKEPLYSVDNVSGLLFYAPKGTNLIGWPTNGASVTGFMVGK
jgi:PQQ-like domain